MESKTKLESSPLKRIRNLQPVDPAKVAALETRLKESYVVGMTEYAREARLRAEAIRDKVLY
jgi:hypothetical protein